MIRHLPVGARILQYADDILLYCRYDELREALTSLEEGIKRLSPWLSSLGLGFAANKSQVCTFDKRRVDVSESVQELGSGRLEVKEIFVYLGVKLERRLSCIGLVVSKALKVVN